MDSSVCKSRSLCLKRSASIVSSSTIPLEEEEEEEEDQPRPLVLREVGLDTPPSIILIITALLYIFFF
jgi:hypothetical protein